MLSHFHKRLGEPIDTIEETSSGEEKRALVSRRGFIRSAAIGAAGAAFALGGTGGVLAGVKDSGEIMLDGLMMSYVAAPLGTTGSNYLTPETAYTMTLGLRSLTSPDIALRARVAPNQERLLIANQARSGEVRDAVVIFPRPDENESFSVGSLGGTPENASFFGLCRPRLKFKGDGRKAQFRLVEAECLFIFSAGQLRDADDGFLDRETASSMLRQYVFNPARLVEPRFVFVQTLGDGEHTLIRRAERDAPEDVTSTVTARIIEQTGFNSEVLQQAFAVGSDLEVTYYSAQDSRGKLLTAKLELERASPGQSQVYWDRVFKTFVIVDKPV